jgi:hypothetical protein
MLTLPVVDETCEYWSQEIASSQHKSVQAHVGPTFMSEIDVSD